MLYCIAQEDSSFRELDSFTLLGVSSILEDACREIELAYGHTANQHSALAKRHREMRAALAAYIEAHELPGDSELARILGDDEEK